MVITYSFAQHFFFSSRFCTHIFGPVIVPGHYLRYLFLPSSLLSGEFYSITLFGNLCLPAVEGAHTITIYIL